MATILAMGGYAVFVWPAYTISFVVLALLIFSSVQVRRRARETVRRLEDEAGRSGDA